MDIFFLDAFKCLINAVLCLRNKGSSTYKKLNKSLPQLKMDTENIINKN